MILKPTSFSGISVSLAEFRENHHFHLLCRLGAFVGYYASFSRSFSQSSHLQEFLGWCCSGALALLNSVFAFVSGNETMVHNFRELGQVQKWKARESETVKT